MRALACHELESPSPRPTLLERRVAGKYRVAGNAADNVADNRVLQQLSRLLQGMLHIIACCRECCRNAADGKKVAGMLQTVKMLQPVRILL